MELPRIADFSNQIPARPYWQIGTMNGTPCLALSQDATPLLPPDSLQFCDLRSVFHLCTPDIAFATARAAELLFWTSNHRFCGRCGMPLSLSSGDISLFCPSCSAKYYPQIAPTVIVRITHGPDKILLAHNKNFAPGIFSLIAGFVEAGESAEQAVHREILEEVGIEVTNIRYLGSQCWPYPNSLMLGFSAEYLTGPISPDGTEIESAAFFTRDSMPSIPRPGSIAARMIRDWLSSPAAPVS